MNKKQNPPLMYKQIEYIYIYIFLILGIKILSPELLNRQNLIKRI